MKRRSFLKGAAGSYFAASAHAQSSASPSLPKSNYRPGRIENHYSLFLDGEREALAQKLSVAFHDDHSLTATLAGSSRSLKPGESIGGWQLLAVAQVNGTATAVFEKHVTHQGAIVYVTESEGEILRVPKHIGQLSSVAPRPTNTPHGIRFTRPAPYVPGPDRLGNYILNSAEDPCYENVAALGAESPEAVAAKW